MIIQVVKSGKKHHWQGETGKERSLSQLLNADIFVHVDF